MRLIKQTDGVVLKRDSVGEITLFDKSSDLSGVGRFTWSEDGYHQLFLRKSEIPAYIMCLVFDSYFEFSSYQPFRNEVLKLLVNYNKSYPS